MGVTCNKVLILLSLQTTSTFMLLTSAEASLKDVEVTKYNQYDDNFGVIIGIVKIHRFSFLASAKPKSISLYVKISGPPMSKL
jgi:hypothetical protein